MRVKTEATIEELYHVESKAELVHGEIVLMSPVGDSPSFAASEIFVSLREYSLRTQRGRAYSDNAGFVVNLPHRKSFSPDAAFFVGARAGMKFLQGAPLFAVEVRSEGDYGVRAEKQIAAKRADYFAAGTQVYWDVDLESNLVVRKYVADSPDFPILFRPGEIADAEPALPGWTMPVNDLFPQE